VANHHTKDKGDLGVVMVISDLVRHGVRVFLPISEHQPSDLIALDVSGRVARVQVKYRSLKGNGCLDIHFRSAYSDSNGYHEKPVDRSQFDCYAIYCPENDKVYYLRNDDIPARNVSGVMLRVLPPANKQKKKVIIASDYEAFGRIFD